MRAVTTILLGAILLAAAPAAAQGPVPAPREGIELALRDIVDDRLPVFSRQSPGDDAGPGMSADRLARVRRASLSLLWPGWSQFRSGNTGRALFFTTAEVAIWTSYAVFNTQGNRREDSYREFAQQFAGVDAAPDEEDYWRAVASYWSSEDYNEDLRRDERVGFGEDAQPYTGELAWSWRSEERFGEYRELRADSIRAFDRASFVTLFAIVNRVASFVDAVRTGVDDATASEIAGFRVDLDVKPSLRNARTSLAISRNF